MIIGFSGLPDKTLVKAFGGEVYAEFGYQSFVHEDSR